MSGREDRYLWLESIEDVKVKEWSSKRDKASRKLLGMVSAKLKPRIEHYYSIPYALMVRTSRIGQFVLLRESGKFKIRLITSDGLTSDLIESTDLGKDVVLQWVYVSDEGDKFALSYSFGGSDEGIFKVVETRSGEVLDELKGVISDIVWLDRDKYFYGRLYQKKKTPDGVAPPTIRIFLREDGKDDMVFGRGIPTSHFIGLRKSTQDSKALLTVSYGWTKSDIYAGELKTPEKWSLVYGKGDFVTWPVDYFKREYLAASFDKGGFGRILAVNENREIREIVEEQPYPLQEAVVSRNRIVASYLVNASSMLKIHSLDTAQTQEIQPQPCGTIDSLDSNGAECVFRYESFSVPYRIYTLEKDKLRILDSTDIQKRLTVKDFNVKSRDSTSIHAFRVGRKDEKGGRILAWGYGGFAVSITPRFYPHLVPFLEDGGTFVAANLRGGNEFGEEWHRRGMRGKKQNVFDDFMAVLESLKSEDSKVVGFGVSNGGLLVGAVLTQRPELLDGALIGYPVLDMLRFHNLFIGKAWVPEYGDPDDPKDTGFLRRYSPYHNVKRQRYPPIMLYTGLHDDRVHPAHAFKFGAKLEEVDASYLLRVETKSGHSGATPTKKIEEYSDIMAFVYKTLQMEAK
ncbi:MAG: prolyl oligopeptidase family serine peptidase [Candidatus Bathyarchaeota archaeon]|jgi:prolyl oligopeptidase